MDLARFEKITNRYAHLRIAIVGDFCLDRYLEIDPAKREISIETGLPVHNVVKVRSQPGGAGTILNNLSALGVAVIFPVGFCGEDGEGFELRRALQHKSGIQLDHFLQTELRRTFTYCKPLMMEPDKLPMELNRLDSKNWMPTPALVQGRLMDSVRTLAREVDAMVVLDQVEHVPALPVRGSIDIVGAGDAVTANLATALAAGATISEAMEIAMAAASVVIHQLGTTGTASVSQVRSLLQGGAFLT